MRGVGDLMRSTEERKSKMFEIYRAYNSRKSFLVFEKGTSNRDALKETIKHHKAPITTCSVVSGWLYNGELYLKDPRRKGAEKRWVGIHGSI